MTLYANGTQSHTEKRYLYVIWSKYFILCGYKSNFVAVFTIKSDEMYKKLILTAALSAASISAFAGGYVTNTNQNVAFLRNPAQNAVIGVQGAYFNPAGVAFMENGWHLAFDVQTAVQSEMFSDCGALSIELKGYTTLERTAISRSSSSRGLGLPCRPAPTSQAFHGPL